MKFCVCGWGCVCVCVCVCEEANHRGLPDVVGVSSTVLHIGRSSSSDKISHLDRRSLTINSVGRGELMLLGKYWMGSKAYLVQVLPLVHHVTSYSGGWWG